MQYDRFETFHSDDWPGITLGGNQLPGEGWYWWSCFPGCLPHGDLNGPFETEDAAIADYNEGLE